MTPLDQLRLDSAKIAGICARYQVAELSADRPHAGMRAQKAMSIFW